ncbi:squamosa promoter-binding-like protein 12 [Zingiber officinale]|uniref:squamosa promoter-binding-like protein 12 n=1 Tax=Zingiber officinale TaxID=94328 RepID=UPI001C4DBCC6|nr:squamosa promoter-binding-like protein 12 [Zingiber officinale]
MWDLDAGIPPAIASTAQRKTPSIGCKDLLDGLGSKTPFQWDWGSPVAFTGREIDIPKDAQEIDLRIEDLCSSGCGASSVLELSNWSDKSSLYASIGSLSDTERRKPELNIQPTERTLQFSDKIIYPWVVDSQTSPIAVETGHPKEPLTGLKLGRNFEDVDAENNIKNFPSASLASSSATIKKSRLSQQNVLSPYCLVDGCNIDLTTAKEYHRKHKICESHSKSPKVIIAGQARRFCQQCSRLHDLSEFDQKKRSCRRRLYDHNARRRKPQTATISFSSSSLSRLNYDDERKMDLVFGQAPMGSSSWDGLTSFHLRQPEESRIKSNKAGCTDRQLQFSTTRTHIGSTACDELNKLLPSKGTTAEVLNQDMGAFVFSPNSERALDLRHALSLLSNDSCGPAERLQISGIKFIDANHTSIADPTTGMVNSTPGMLQDQQPLVQSTLLSFNSQNSNYQFHLLQAPHGGSLSDTQKLHMLDHCIDFDSEVSFQR